MSYHMTKGKWYRITYRTDNQKVDREAVMQYLGHNEQKGYSAAEVFDARPVAGTQAIFPPDIKAAVEVPPYTEPYVGRIAR